jgi:serine/threonine protein kinase
MTCEAEPYTANANLQFARIADRLAERLIAAARPQISAARCYSRKRQSAVRDVEHKALQLAGSIYPEIAVDAGLPHRKLEEFDNVQPVASSNHPMFVAVNGDQLSVVLKEFVVGQKDLPRFRNELSLLNRLSQCDGVVKILSAFLDGHRAYIEMPRYTFGSLLQWVRDTNPSAEVRLQSAHRIASALERIHALGVVHCDIKPDNVFVDDDGLPYIGDFDVSMPTADRTRLFSTQTIAHGGTPAYMAPELIRGQSATKASDIYSLGLVILDLFGDGTPRAVGAAPVVPRSLANALKTLLESMLLADPAARPSASSVVGSAAFRSVLVSAPLPIVAPLYWNQPRLVGTIPLLVDVTAEMRDVLQQLVDRTIVQGALGMAATSHPVRPHTRSWQSPRWSASSRRPSTSATSPSATRCAPSTTAPRRRPRPRRPRRTAGTKTMCCTRP